MSDETKFWHAECPTSGIYIDLKTTGHHDQDLTEVPVGCLACDGEHVAVQVTEAEHLGYTRDEPDTPTPPSPKLFLPGPEDMTGNAFGVYGTSIGEDGDWLFLGHVPPRKAVAAMLRIGRDDIGLSKDEIVGDPPGTWAELEADVEHRWALFRQHPEVCGCGHCEGDGWVAYWAVDEPDSSREPVTEHTPNAVPVTLWRGL